MKKIIFILSILILLVSCTNNSSSSSSTPSTSHSFVYTGGKGIITQGAYVFTSESALKQSISAYAAGNTAESASIVARSAFEVNAGDKLTILENKLATSKVRMTSGKNSGRTGWIPYKFIRKE